METYIDVAVKVLGALGGVGVIVFGLAGFLGGFWRDRYLERERRNTELLKAQEQQRTDLLKEQERQRTELLLETVRQQLGPRRVQADRFAESQFDVYVRLWKSLQGLSISADVLWEKVTKRNIDNLLTQLRAAEQEVNDWAMFFEEEHRAELRRCFDIIESFRSGKLELNDIRTKKDLEYVDVKEIKFQVESNREYRDELRRVLDDLARHFRERLSSADVRDLT